MATLNKQLLITQAVNNKQIKKLQKLYTKLDTIFANAASSSDKPAVSAALTKLEFKLQKYWNFPQDALYHSYQFRLPGCICPKLDNAERFGHEKIITNGCPYHAPIPVYKPIKITDGTYTQLKPESTKTIAIDLNELDQYLTVKLPSGFVLVVEPNHLTVFDVNHNEIFSEEIPSS